MFIRHFHMLWKQEKMSNGHNVWTKIKQGGPNVVKKKKKKKKKKKNEKKKKRRKMPERRDITLC